MTRTLLALLLTFTLLGPVWASDGDVWHIDEGTLFAQGVGLSDEESGSSAYDQALEAYERATRALDNRNWENAVDEFERVISIKGQRVDASLYWLAYSLNKLNKRAEALDALAKLQSSSFSNSRWREDAKALEYQIREASGQKISPELAEDEELKLMIINNLIHTDPQRAVPLLEKLLQENNPPQIKERALFVLAQSETERGFAIIADYARGAGEPDLQMRAVEYLGVFGDGNTGALLEDIYRSSTDTDVKRKILESFMIADENDRLLSVAREENDKRLRMKAIEQLGVNDQVEALWELYQVETDDDVKRKLIEGFMIADASGKLQSIARGSDVTALRLKAVEQLGILDESDMLWDIYQEENETDVRAAILTGIWLSDDVDRLIDVAKTEADPRLRRAAIEKLGLSDGVRVEQAVTTLYMDETDDSVKRKLLEAMFLQDNVDGLIQIARTEKDPQLRRDAVEKLSIMDSEEATDFLLQLLED